MAQGSCCKLEDKNSACCASENAKEENLALAHHWDQAYLQSSEDQLGWYERDFSPSMNLLNKCQLQKEDSILLVGAGTSRLPDHLLDLGYTSLTVTDISAVALDQVKSRLGDQISYRVGDILNVQTLATLAPVKLWMDRAVLHFFHEGKEQKTYFDHLHQKIALGGYALFAEFNLEGATRCSGLDVFRYNAEMLAERLGPSFRLLETFDWEYTMPSGGKRPYVYALFQKLEDVVE